MKVVVVALFAAAGLAGCGSSSRPAPAAPEPDPVIGTAPTSIDPAMLERGAYGASIAGCAACHGKDLAGGLEVRGEGGAGVWRAPNITPEPATGIGEWTDDQIRGAIR